MHHGYTGPAQAQRSNQVITWLERGRRLRYLPGHHRA